MKLSIKAMAITSAILWGAAVFLTALLNRFFPHYGEAFLQMVASIYPGYTVGGMKMGIVGTLYAALDGAVVGALFAWLYNMVAGKTADVPAAH